jgi:hypothetical protein
MVDSLTRLIGRRQAPPRVWSSTGGTAQLSATPRLRREATRDRSPWTRARLLPAGLLGLLLLTVVIDVTPAPGAARAVLTLLTALLLPGSAILLRVSGGPSWFVLAVAVPVSLSIEIVLSSAMIFARLWHPVLVAVLLVSAAAAMLVHGALSAGAEPGPVRPELARMLERLRGALRGDRADLALLLVAGALWGVSIPLTSTAGLGVSGLLPNLPLTWYVALGLVVVGVVRQVHRRDASSPVAWAFVLLAALILYGTIPAVSRYPQYSYTYKHIGVTHLFMASGRLSPSVDIYNHWPGFFAAAAAFARVTGVDPLSFASWFEPISTFIDALLVGALAGLITRERRAPVLAAALWLGIDWVGQSYYSPQGAVFLISLGLALVLVQHSTSAGLGGSLIRRVARVISRRDQEQRALVVEPWLSRRCATAIVLGCAVAISATHQLTPYMLALWAGALALFGGRPRWLWLGILLVAAAYLAPNLAYVQHNYGLFSGFDPVRNAQVTQGTPTHRAWFFSHIGQMLTFFSLALGGFAAVRLARRRQGYPAGLLLVLTLAPFAVLFLNSYGGEGVLRAVLFSSPWMAVLGAWGIVTLGGLWRVLVSALASTVVIGLLAAGAMGDAAFNLMPNGEVAASLYFYSHAPAGSGLMLAGPDFPGDIGARYAVMRGHSTESHPNVLEYPEFEDHLFGPADVPQLASDLRALSPHGFIAFSTSEYNNARLFGLTVPGALSALERAVAGSRLFHLWYEAPNVRIYRLAG